MEDELKIDDVWQLLFERLKDSDRSTAEELRLWLSKQKDNAAAKALTDDLSSGWTASEIRRLQQQLVNDFRPAKRALIMHLCLNALVRSWIQKTEIQVPSPPAMIRHRLARNPWRQDVVKGVLFQATAKTDLEKAVISAASKDPFDALALGLASGIIHLGLLDPDCILAVLRSLADPHRNLCWLGKVLVIRQSLPVRGFPDSENRIYIPDPLTAILLLQVTAKEAGDLVEATQKDAATTKQILGRISARIQAAMAIGKKGKTPRYSLKALLKNCSGAALYWRSPVTVSYLTRKLISHSPTLETLARIEPTCQLLFLPAEKARTARTPALESRRKKLLHSKDDAPEQDQDDSPVEEPVGLMGKTPEPRSFSPLRVAMGGKDKQKARRRLNSLLKDGAQSPAIRSLTEFATWTLSPRNAKRRNLRTIRDGISLLSRFLLPLFDDEDDPAEIARTGIEDLYLESIDIHQDSPSGESLSSQRKFAQWLVRFHAFLVELHNAKPLEELRAVEAGCLPVDANLIVEDEFQRVLAAIRVCSSIPEEQREVAEWLLVLSIRTGLRHNESYWIRPCDFDFGNVCMLVVQPYNSRKLKTRNALRRLNLTALLLPDELNRLRAFISAHQHEPSVPIFPPAPRNGLLDEDDLFASLHRILRETLSDQRLRYHHGRHSMGSLLALQLLSESTSFYEYLFPSRQEALARLNASPKIREALYGCTTPQVSAIDGLSDQIGHGNPKFTIAHYVHSLGLLAAAELACMPEFSSDRTTMIAAWYQHTSSIYRYASKGLECIPEQKFLDRFDVRIRQVTEQRKQKARARPRVPRLTEFEKELATLTVVSGVSSQE